MVCMSLLPARLKSVGSKTTEKRWRHRFPYYKPMGGGGFLLPWKPAFWSNLPPQPYAAFLHPSDATHKIDQDWPAGFRDIQVWKCGRRRTGDGPLAYYKLTFWAFGSGELNMNQVFYYFFFITLTSPCNLVPRKPHFYIAKLGFTGVYRISSFSAFLLC